MPHRSVKKDADGLDNVADFFRSDSEPDAVSDHEHSCMTVVPDYSDLIMLNKSDDALEGDFLPKDISSPDKLHNEEDFFHRVLDAHVAPKIVELPLNSPQIGGKAHRIVEKTPKIVEVGQEPDAAGPYWDIGHSAKLQTKRTPVLKKTIDAQYSRDSIAKPKLTSVINKGDADSEYSFYPEDVERRHRINSLEAENYSNEYSRNAQEKLPRDLNRQVERNNGYQYSKNVDSRRKSRVYTEDIPINDGRRKSRVYNAEHQETDPRPVFRSRDQGEYEHVAPRQEYVNTHRMSRGNNMHDQYKYDETRNDYDHSGRNAREYMRENEPKVDIRRKSQLVPSRRTEYRGEPNYSDHSRYEERINHPEDFHSGRPTAELNRERGAQVGERRVRAEVSHRISRVPNPNIQVSRQVSDEDDYEAQNQYPEDVEDYYPPLSSIRRSSTKPNPRFSERGVSPVEPVLRSVKKAVRRSEFNERKYSAEPQYVEQFEEVQQFDDAPARPDVFYRQEYHSPSPRSGSLIRQPEYPLQMNESLGGTELAEQGHYNDDYRGYSEENEGHQDYETSIVNDRANRQEPDTFMRSKAPVKRKQPVGEPGPLNRLKKLGVQPVALSRSPVLANRYNTHSPRVRTPLRSEIRVEGNDQDQNIGSISPAEENFEINHDIPEPDFSIPFGDRIRKSRAAQASLSPVERNYEEYDNNVPDYEGANNQGGPQDFENYDPEPPINRLKKPTKEPKAKIQTVKKTAVKAVAKKYQGPEIYHEELVKPDEDDSQRRSRRIKVQPVAYWKNERVVYGRRESGVHLIKDVIRVASDEEKPKPKSKQSIKIKDEKVSDLPPVPNEVRVINFATKVEELQSTNILI